MVELSRQRVYRRCRPPLIRNNRRSWNRLLSNNSYRRNRHQILSSSPIHRPFLRWICKQNSFKLLSVTTISNMSFNCRDIVKLTAQFVARNGRQFLTNLMNREQRNYQFDFLRPQHSLFQYFTKLLEQYTKILIPPKDLMERLRTESSMGKHSTGLVLEHVKYRANWQKHQEAQKKREEEKVERERGMTDLILLYWP